MFAIDHGQPGSLTLPSHLQHGTDPGCRGYARWAERTRLVADAEENRRERRALRRLRRQAEALRRRAEHAEARVSRLEAVVRAH